jgi:hypothetical protein
MPHSMLYPFLRMVPKIVSRSYKEVVGGAKNAAQHAANRLMLLLPTTHKLDPLWVYGPRAQA